MLKVELSRFRVKAGKSEKVDEWLSFLNDHMEDTLLTLEGEKMYVESIHRECTPEADYLYWYSVQGENGTDIRESDSYIDKKHLEYWDECIDEAYRPVNLLPSVVMISDKVRTAMDDSNFNHR